MNNQSSEPALSGERGIKMNYFEVLYKNCFGAKRVATVATKQETPEIPTGDFNFNWNGNQLVKYRETDYQSYATNTHRFFTESV
jgi:hypothetical protein